VSLAPSALLFAGEVVERQTYLNGARYYLIEGEAAGAATPWSIVLACTLPKAASDPVTEGDLCLRGESHSWDADVVTGGYREDFDERVAAEVIALTLVLRRREGEAVAWIGAIAHVSIENDAAEIRLEADPTGRR